MFKILFCIRKLKYTCRVNAHNFGFLHVIHNYYQKLTIHDMKPVKLERTYYMTPKRKYHHVLADYKQF